MQPAEKTRTGIFENIQVVECQTHFGNKGISVHSKLTHINTAWDETLNVEAKTLTAVLRVLLKAMSVMCQTPTCIMLGHELFEALPKDESKI